jgi:multidrug resistance efflux pump
VTRLDWTVAGRKWRKVEPEPFTDQQIRESAAEHLRSLGHRGPIPDNYVEALALLEKLKAAEREAVEEEEAARKEEADRRTTRELERYEALASRLDFPRTKAAIAKAASDQLDQGASMVIATLDEELDECLEQIEDSDLSERHQNELWGRVREYADKVRTALGRPQAVE